MIIYPALDLRGGAVVRLREGDPQRQVKFNSEPLVAARRWIDQGAAWLHVVNLDGAFSEANDNLRVLEQVARLGTPVQFGGGLRDREQMQRAIDSGASRIVLGTVALAEPRLVEEAVDRYGAGAVCVALDARDGHVTTHGWQQASDTTPVALGAAMARVGVKHALFTDVSRDGLLGGVNLAATEQLARATGLQVIASGGVSKVEEIRALRAGGLVAGAVIGMALYRGDISLREALAAAWSDPDAK